MSGGPASIHVIRPPLPLIRVCAACQFTMSALYSTAYMRPEMLSNSTAIFPSARTVDDHARVLQHLEVLGDRGPGYGEPPGELAHRVRPFAEDLEDRAPGRITQSFEYRPRLVSCHER